MSSLEDRLKLGRMLGKLPVKIDRTTPTFRWLMDSTTPLITPNSVNWAEHIDFWPMLGNDKISDCTVAAILHQVQLWTANAGIQQIPDLSCAIAAYAHATGYDPITGKNDNGAFMLDMLRYWMITGVPVSQAGALDRLDGYAVIDPGDIESISRAIYTFGCVYAGVELPTTADDEFGAGQDFSNLSAAPGSAGGHCWPLVGVTPQGLLCVTWGKLKMMTWAWWMKYGSECYAVLRREWIGAQGLSPSRLTMTQLDAKLTSIRGTLGLGAFA